MEPGKIHSEAEKLDLEKRLRDSVVHTLENLVNAWEARPSNLPADQVARLQEAIAQAEQLKEKLDALIVPATSTPPLKKSLS